MKTVAIETSGGVGSVAVLEDEQLRGERAFEKGMRHGRELIPTLKRIFDTLEWRPNEIDLIAVSIGPGSYTGLRVGIACTKALAYATGAEVIGVPTLDVLARNAPETVCNVCPVLDARRKHVYASLYSQRNEGLARQTDFLVVPPQELARMLPEGTLVFGDGTAKYRTVLEAANVAFGEDDLGVAHAPVVAQLGLLSYRAGERTDVNTLTPMYLRRPEAEETWEQKFGRG